MKKRIIIILALLCLLPLFILPASAVAGVDADILPGSVPDEAQQYIDGVTPESGDVKKASEGLLQGALNIFKNQLKGAVAGAAAILSVCAFISLATAFCKSSGIEIPQKVADVTAVCALLAVTFGPINSILVNTVASIKQLGIFAGTLFPIFGTAVAISGSPVTAVSSSAAALFFATLIIETASAFFVPAVYVYIVVSAAGIVAENDLLKRLAEFIRWLSVSCFKVFIMVFTAYLSLSGVISGSTDAMALKAAKAAASTFIPVLGAAVSDASEAVLSGAAVAKSALGIYGFIAACAICLMPIVRALVQLLLYKVLAAASASLAGGGCAKMVECLADACGIIVGLLATCCAIFFISIIVSTVVTAR